MSYVPIAVSWSRGTGDLGSTGPPQVFWTQKVTDQRPEKECIFTAKGHHPETIIITGLISMGADVTITLQLFFGLNHDLSLKQVLESWGWVARLQVVCLPL